MENLYPSTTEKLSAIMQYLPMGVAEINEGGAVSYLNAQAYVLLKPIWIASNLDGENFYPVLDYIAPDITEKIKETAGEIGVIIINELHSFPLAFGGETVERHFSFTITRTAPGCLIAIFDDITARRGKDQAIRDLQAEKAMLQGKFEIASNILHDIGNAVVAFGSYITRIKRILEESNSGNLQNLAIFFTDQQMTLNGAFGETRAAAMVSMLNGISEGEKKAQEEITKSVTEQLNVITHIQAILNIQRQYINGQETQENKPVKLASIVGDCYSMLFASLEKRGIKMSIDIPEGLPAIIGDRNSLMQVILNVLKNSIEAIDLAAAKKNIAVHAMAGEGIVVLTLEDNGTGFDKATGAQLFKRGFTTKAAGSGLGLHHCRAIIEKHGGTMDIASAGFGRGAKTTIKFTI